MIVIAIIGILASISVPSYKNYTTRAKLTEAVLALGSVRPLIQTSYEITGSLPTENVVYKPRNGASGDLIIYLKWQASTKSLEANFGGSAGDELFDKILMLKPTINSNGGLTWTCMDHPNPARAVPSGLSPC